LPDYVRGTPDGYTAFTYTVQVRLPDGTSKPIERTYLVKNDGDVEEIKRGLDEISGMTQASPQSASALSALSNTSSSTGEYLLILDFSNISEEELETLLEAIEETFTRDGILQNDWDFLGERAYSINASQDEVLQLKILAESLGLITSLYSFADPQIVNATAIDNKPKQNGTIDFSFSSSTLTPEAKITLYLNDNNDNFSGTAVHEMTYAELERVGNNYLGNWTPMGVMPGTYYAYIYVEDGNAMPIMQWFNGTVTILLGAPANVDATVTSETSAVIKWTPVAGAEEYTLQRKGGSGNQGWQIVYTGAGTEYTESDLVMGGEYEYRLQATGSNQTKEFSFTLATPGIPSFTASGITKTDSTITLVWTAPTTDGTHTGYELRYRTAPEGGTAGGWSSVINLGTSSTGTTISSDLNPNTRYEFELVTVNGIGQSTAATVFVTTEPTPIVFDGAAITATKTHNSVTLTWDAIVGTTAFSVNYTSGTAQNAVWNTDTEKWSVTFEELSPATSYAFTVTITPAVGFSVPTDLISKTVTTGVAAPGTPRFTEGSITKTDSTITLVWTAPTTGGTQTGYELRYRTAPEGGTAGGWSKVYDFGASSTGTPVGDLSPNTRYEFELVAVNGTGKSDPTIVFVTTTDADVLPHAATPTLVSVTGSTIGNITVSFTPPANTSGIVRYEIQYGTTVPPAGGAWTHETRPVTLADAANPTTFFVGAGTWHVRIVAIGNHTTHGDSDPSNSTSAVVTNEVKLSLPPSSVSGSIFGKLIVDWAGPENAVVGAVSGYEIQYMQSTTGVPTNWAGAMVHHATTTARQAQISVADGTWYARVIAVGATVGGVTYTNSDPSSANTVGAVVTDAAPDPTKPIVIAVDNAATTSSVTLSWGAQSGVTYTLKYKEKDAADWEIWEGEIGDTNATVTGLAPNTSYDFRLTATNASGSATSTVEATTIATPLTVTGDTNSVVISWTAALPEGGVFQFKHENSDDWMTWKGIFAENTATIPGLAAGMCEVQLVDAAGNVLHKETVTVAAPTDGIVVPKALKPKAKVHKKLATINSVTVSWTDPRKADNTRYVVSYSIKVGKRWTVVDQFSTAENRHTFTGLNPNTSYRVTVTAINAEGKPNTNKAGKVTSSVNITAKTLKYTAVRVSKPVKFTTEDGAARVEATVRPPAKVPAGATYENYALYLDMGTRAEVRFVPVTDFTFEGNTLTIDWSELELSDTANNRFVLRAVTDGVESAGAKFTIRFSTLKAKV